MLTVILVLVLSVAYCNGQRRWAGSYSGVYAPGEMVTWDNRNYPMPDIEASTEANVRYRGKWPADNQKEHSAFDVPSPGDSRERDGARREERTRVEIRQEKGIYETPPRERRIQPSPGEFNARGGGRPVVISERDRNNRKEEVPIGDEDYNSRQNARGYKGDVGKVNEELLRDDNRRRRPLPPPPPPPNDRYGNREKDNRHDTRENRNHRAHEERPVVKIAADDTRPPLHDYATSRSETRGAAREAGKDGRPRRDDKDKSGNDDAGEVVSYHTGESRYESPKIEEPQNPRREINNKGDMGAMPREIPDTRRQQWDHSREDYDDKETDAPGRYRPKGSEEQLAAREYTKIKGQPQIAVHGVGQADDLQSKGDRGVHKQVYGIEVANTGRYNRTEEHFIPTYNKGDVHYDDSDEERVIAREFDRRREEEMKQREYERRLEEEMKKRQEETRTFRPEVATDRRREDVTRNNRNGREDRPVGGRRLDVEKGIPRSYQEDSSDKEHDNQRRTIKVETNERNFGTRRDNDWTKGVNIEGQINPTYSRQGDERRREHVKGDIYIRREGRAASRTTIVRDNKELAEVQNSKGTQGDRIEGRAYDGKKKGEAYNRESDYTLKRSSYNQSSSQSRIYRNGGQRTADSTVTSDDLHSLATSENDYHGRKSSNGDSMPEHSVVQGTSNPMRGIEGNGRNQRNQERSNHNTSNQRGEVDPRVKAVYIRRSVESADRDFKSTEANDRHGRRTYSRGEEVITPLLNNERARRRSDKFGSDSRYSRSVDRTSSVYTFPGRSSDEQPTRNGSLWRQRSTDKVSNRREVYGYHPNVSYDSIVFIDDESDDETDIWNLSGQKTKESDHTLNVDQDEYRSETSGLTPSARESQTRRQHSRNIISGDTEVRKRNRRAPIDYLVQETAVRVGQSQTEDPDYIHPDVELLPGYTTAKQLDQRNYNDYVLDGEVEVFSEKEIKVNATDYKRFGGITAKRTATDESQSSKK